MIAGVDNRHQQATAFALQPRKPNGLLPASFDHWPRLPSRSSLAGQAATRSGTQSDLLLRLAS
jgi:hypothetical protein